MAMSTMAKTDTASRTSISVKARAGRGMTSDLFTRLSVLPLPIRLAALPPRRSGWGEGGGESNSHYGRFDPRRVRGRLFPQRWHCPDAPPSTTELNFGFHSL